MPAAVAVPPVVQAPRLKIISLGESGVGKSCLIKRYCEDKFVTKHVATIGIDFGVKPVEVAGAVAGAGCREPVFVFWRVC